MGVRFGVAVVDVGMSRGTPFGSCAGLNQQVERLAPYLDEQVISPQIRAWRTAVVALCGPAVESVSETADPYIDALRPYMHQLVSAAWPITNRVLSIARPIGFKMIAGLRPQIERFEDAVEDIVEKLDNQVDEAVMNLDADKVFVECEQEAVAFAQFAKAHAADTTQAIAQASAAVHEIADEAAGTPRTPFGSCAGTPRESHDPDGVLSTPLFRLRGA